MVLGSSPYSRSVCLVEETRILSVLSGLSAGSWELCMAAHDPLATPKPAGQVYAIQLLQQPSALALVHCLSPVAQQPHIYAAEA